MPYKTLMKNLKGTTEQFFRKIKNGTVLATE
jgi:hypothetical protein